jgi:subtilisin family serine protease
MNWLGLLLLLLSLEVNARIVTVAVIDTGGEVQHPDLNDNLWTNPGESGRDNLGRDRSNNKIDDDGNGYADDVHGWNFVDASPDISDRHGHGTHVAGIIRRNAPQARLMLLKYYSPKSSYAESIANTVAAIKYALKMGVSIINYSAGGAVASHAEYQAIVDAGKQGVLFVAAAGNDGHDVDKDLYFPAGYGLSNLLSVAAFGSSRQLIPSSNFGRARVMIAAPGDAIWSALPQGRHGLMTGTSQATAFATGTAAALLASSHELLAPEQVIARLMGAAQTTPDLGKRIRSGALANPADVLKIQGRDQLTRNLTETDVGMFSSESDFGELHRED